MTTRLALGLLLALPCCTGSEPRDREVASSEAKTPAAEAVPATKPAAPVKAAEAEPAPTPSKVEPPAPTVAPAVAAPAVAAPVVAPTTPAVAKPIFVESLGPLQLGMTLAEVKAAHPTLVLRDAVHPVPPDGGPIDAIAGYVQSYRDEAADLHVTLRAATKDGEFRVTNVTADRNATVATKAGIRIGSKRSAVKKAYPKARELVEDELYARISEHEQVLCVFEDGKVYAIALGPPTDPEDIEE